MSRDGGGSGSSVLGQWGFRRVVTAVLGAIGVVSLLLSVAVVVFPDPWPGVGVPTGRGPLLVAAALVGLLVFRVLYARDWDLDSDPGVSFPTPPSPREPSEQSASLAGSDLDDRIEQVTSSEQGGVGRAVSRKRVRDRVYRTAVAVIRDTESCSRATATDRIDRGLWTDRPRARAFLAEDVELPVSVRIRDWVSGEGFERQVRATVEELAVREGVESGELAPEPVGLDELPDFDPADPDPAPPDWREHDPDSRNEDQEPEKATEGPELFRRELVGAGSEPWFDGDSPDGDGVESSNSTEAPVEGGEAAGAATERSDPT